MVTTGEDRRGLSLSRKKKEETKDTLQECRALFTSANTHSALTLSQSHVLFRLLFFLLFFLVDLVASILNFRFAEENVEM